jgi:hypothetical protein
LCRPTDQARLGAQRRQRPGTTLDDALRIGAGVGEGGEQLAAQLDHVLVDRLRPDMVEGDLQVVEVVDGRHVRRPAAQGERVGLVLHARVIGPLLQGWRVGRRHAVHQAVHEPRQIRRCRRRRRVRRRSRGGGGLRRRRFERGVEQVLLLLALPGQLHGILTGSLGGTEQVRARTEEVTLHRLGVRVGRNAHIGGEPDRHAVGRHLDVAGHRRLGAIR